VKASEAIRILEQLINEHGDKHLFIEDWNEQYAMPAEARTIVYDDFDSADIFVIDA